jgi:hypothetical protein
MRISVPPTAAALALSLLALPAPADSTKGQPQTQAHPGQVSRPSALALGPDVLTINSLTPSSGTVQILPGGGSATPAALNPSNTIVAHVTFPSAASYQKVRLIALGGASIPANAPSGQNGPNRVMKPFVKEVVTGTGPVQMTVEFGYACYPNSMPQTTITSVEIVGLENAPLTTPGYVISGKIPANLVINCSLRRP